MKMECLHDLVEIYNNNIEYLSFLSGFKEYVSGTFAPFDLICVDSLVNRRISDCFPSGRYIRY